MTRLVSLKTFLKNFYFGYCNVSDTLYNGGMLSNNTQTGSETMNAVQMIQNAVKNQSTEVIYACIRQIGGAFDIDQDSRVTRAALIQEIADREGDEAADKIMDELGM
mgnify:CR=1 FL=1